MITQTEKHPDWPEWLPFDYDDFYDLPRRIRVKTNDAVYFLDCTFNNDLDDYEESYGIYRIVGARTEDAANARQWSQVLERRIPCWLRESERRPLRRHQAKIRAQNCSFVVIFPVDSKRQNVKPVAVSSASSSPTSRELHSFASATRRRRP